MPWDLPGPQLLWGMDADISVIPQHLSGRQLIPADPPSPAHGGLSCLEMVSGSGWEK